MADSAAHTQIGDRHSKIREILRAFSFTRISVVYVEIAAIIVFLIWVPNLFGSVTTATGILNDNAITALVALALIAPLAAGVFDLSVGYCLGATSVLAAWLLGNTGLNTAEVVLLSIAFAAGVGAVNGLVVVVMKVDSFIATLATGALLQAAILIISGDQTLNQGFTSSFLKLGQAKLGQVTAPVFVSLGVTIVLWYVLGHTALGRRVYATGLAEEPARLAGIRTGWIRFTSLVASSTIAGIAGILLAAIVTAGSPTVGPSYLIPAFAAAFLGATQFRDRLFNAWGTVFAVWLLGTLTSGLALTGAPLWMPYIFQGGVLIVALTLGSLQSRRAAGSFAFWRKRLAPNPQPTDAFRATPSALAMVSETTGSPVSPNPSDEPSAEADQLLSNSDSTGPRN
jgi:ribose transport system permease protein